MLWPVGCKDCMFVVCLQAAVLFCQGARGRVDACCQDHPFSIFFASSTLNYIGLRMNCPPSEQNRLSCIDRWCSKETHIPGFSLTPKSFCCLCRINYVYCRSTADFYLAEHWINILPWNIWSISQHVRQSPELHRSVFLHLFPPLFILPAAI